MRPEPNFTGRLSVRIAPSRKDTLGRTVRFFVDHFRPAGRVGRSHPRPASWSVAQGKIGCSRALRLRHPKLALHPRKPRRTLRPGFSGAFLTAQGGSGHSHLLAHDGYDATRSSTWLKRPSEFDRPLGPLQSPAKRDGYTDAREFRHASVRIDVKAEPATFTWHRDASARAAK